MKINWTTHYAGFRTTEIKQANQTVKFELEHNRHAEDSYEYSTWWILRSITIPDHNCNDHTVAPSTRCYICDEWMEKDDAFPTIKDAEYYIETTYRSAGN